MQAIKIRLNEFVPDISKRAPEEDKLKKACKEFESIFTYQLLKSMRRTIDKTDLFHGGYGEEIFESLLDQELAKNIAYGDSNNLAEMLYKQLKRKGLSKINETEDIRGLEDLSHVAPLWPLKARVSSKFGWRKDPFNGQDRFHYGIDLAAREGTPVRASLSGKVLVSDYRKGYGNLVVLDNGRGLNTLYAHNQENLVKPGDWVKRGTPLAKVGSSGRSTGAHLHFEVKKMGKHIDPLNFLGL